MVATLNLSKLLTSAQAITLYEQLTNFRMAPSTLRQHVFKEHIKVVKAGHQSFFRRRAIEQLAKRMLDHPYAGRRHVRNKRIK